MEPVREPWGEVYRLETALTVERNRIFPDSRKVKKLGREHQIALGKAKALGREWERMGRRLEW